MADPIQFDQTCIIIGGKTFPALWYVGSGSDRQFFRHKKDAIKYLKQRVAAYVKALNTYTVEEATYPAAKDRSCIVMQIRIRDCREYGALNEKTFDLVKYKTPWSAADYRARYVPPNYSKG